MTLPTAEEARRLREEATGGEWEAKRDWVEAPSHNCVPYCSAEDAALIAAAVNNFVPLAERVEELEKALRQACATAEAENAVRNGAAMYRDDFKLASIKTMRANKRKLLDD